MHTIYFKAFMLDDEEMRSYANEQGELTIGWLQMH